VSCNRSILSVATSKPYVFEKESGGRFRYLPKHRAFEADPLPAGDSWNRARLVSLINMLLRMNDGDAEQTLEDLLKSPATLALAQVAIQTLEDRMTLAAWIARLSKENRYHE